MNLPILVTGSLAYDFIMDFPGKFVDNIDTTKIHNLNVSFLVERLKKHYGGTAANIAYSLALLGQSPMILGVAGNDFNEHSQFLKDHGVDTSLIQTIETEATALAMMITDLGDNQISAFYPGAMNYSKDLHLPNLEVAIVSISPNVPELMISLAKECKKTKVPYMFDPGRQLPRLAEAEIEEGINGAKILITNDYELGMIKKKLSLSDEDLLERSEIIVTTLADKGSLVQTKNKKFTIPPAKPLYVMDPTGAGDAYHAGFLSGYLSGKSLETCGKMGAVTACYAIEKYGTTSHYFTQKDFIQRYEENFGEKLEL